MKRCHFCPKKAHSKACGKCADCCRANYWLATMYHPKPKARVAKAG